jgi:hypothetical protein
VQVLRSTCGGTNAGRICEPCAAAYRIMGASTGVPLPLINDRAAHRPACFGSVGGSIAGGVTTH